MKAFKLWQLARKVEGQGYDLTTKQKFIRISKISQEMADRFNENAEDSGKYYELDEEITKRIQSQIPINKILSNKRTPEPEPEPEIKTLSPEQIKYNSRKQKMLDAGFEFTDETFKKGNIEIKAEELVNLAPVKFGKLLK